MQDSSLPEYCAKSMVDFEILQDEQGICCSNGQICHGVFKDDTTELWFYNGVYHRDDGPAIIINNGTYFIQEWIVNGKLHRVDGPASITESPRVTITEYYFEGKYCSFKEWIVLVWEHIPPDKKKEYIFNGFGS